MIQLLREVSSRVPVATVAAPVSSVETPIQSTNVTVTTDQVPPLMKKYHIIITIATPLISPAML